MSAVTASWEGPKVPEQKDETISEIITDDFLLTQNFKD